jgi:TPR repeat protein
MYDYGTPYVAPPMSPEQIAAERLRNEKVKKDGADAALKANEDAAANGDTYGLLRMGERYRDGDGVETNLMMAHAYLTRAALAGDQTASNELAQLPQISTSTNAPTH